MCRTRMFLVVLFLFLVLPLLVRATTITDLLSQISQLTQLVQQLQAQLVALQSNSTSSTVYSTITPTSLQATQNITPPTWCSNPPLFSLNTSSTHVHELQRFLTQTGDFTYGEITSYYGQETRLAVERYQCREMNLCSGSPSNNGYGLAGPGTRRAMCIADVVTTSAPVTVATPILSVWSGTFIRDLSLGMRGDDVLALQQFLADEGYYTGIVGGYFGELTQTAVQAYQRVHGIVSGGTPATTGYGAVGPRTRTHINERRSIEKTDMPVTVSDTPLPDTISESPIDREGTPVSAEGSLTYRWQTSEWSACENGIRTRSVACVASTGDTADDSQCVMVRPSMREPCSLGTTSDEICAAVKGSDINVRWFGAKGNGVSDDTGAIKDAFNCMFTHAGARSNKSGRVYFPAGTYILNEQISKTNIQDNQLHGLQIEGDGRSTTVIHTGSQQGVFNFSFAGNGFTVQMQDFSLVPTKNNAGTAINIEAPDRGITMYSQVILRNMTIGTHDSGFGYFTKGVRLFASKRSFLQDVTILGGSGANRFNMEDCVQFHEGYGPMVINMTCRNATYGVAMTSDKLGGEAGPEGGTILSSSLEDVTYGWYIRTHSIEPGATLSNTTIKATEAGVLVEGHKVVTIERNTFGMSSYHTGGTYTDLSLEGFQESQIFENVFRGVASNRTHVRLADLPVLMANGNRRTFNSTSNMIYDNDFLSGAVSVIEEGQSLGQNSTRDNY